MSTADPKEQCPQDIVAIFHASFHPTKGNTIDWSLKASDDLSLDHLEFNVLPSGLHLVEQDVVYFTKDDQYGVCVFRRRKSSEEGFRGVRLSSLAILLAKGTRPRPWRHLKALKALTDTIYSRVEDAHDMELSEEDWEPARQFFEERKIRRADLGGAADWTGWSDELDGAFSQPLGSSPTAHLPHLLRILGPSALTLYKHVLGRKRILIYTLPPVEVSCILCQIAADICFDAQTSSSPDHSRLKGKHKEPISVLGMITLTDIDRLAHETRTGRGWIACTTDALFLEKPSHYDLLIDLTTSTPAKASRPTFYASKFAATQQGPYRGQTHKLSTIRFSWSDVKLWNEIDRILRLDAQEGHGTCCGLPNAQDAPVKSPSITAWTDVWQVYEDVCIICAGLWIGSWRGNSRESYTTRDGPENWGAIRLAGDDDLSLRSTYVRNVGMGIEGRPSTGPVASSSGSTLNSNQRTSAMSWASSKATIVGTRLTGKARGGSSSNVADPAVDENEGSSTGLEERQRNTQISTTFALLQTFHAQTAFQLSVLEDVISRQGISSDVVQRVVVMTPKDILAFELGPLSGFDVRYLEWFADEYAGDDVRVVIKRGWRDMLGVLFGYV